MSEEGVNLVPVDVADAGESTNSANQQNAGQNRTLHSSIPFRSAIVVAPSRGGFIVVVVAAGFGIEEPAETLGRRNGGGRRTAERLLLLLLRLFEGRAWLEEMESIAESEGGVAGERERRGSETQSDASHLKAASTKIELNSKLCHPNLLSFSGRLLGAAFCDR